MSASRPVVLRRDCPATTVPAGETVLLSAGGEVQVVQQLGASATVRTTLGLLLRVDTAHLDALGLDPPSGSVRSTSSDAGDDFDLTRVYAALSQVYDPEIPVDIVELGLVYRCEERIEPDGGRRIEIDMSMTAPGCGMGDVLRGDAARAVLAVPGVDDVAVDLVWDPPWDISRMSEAARLQLGLL